ncbi:MAG: polysaccharide biosynthesis/export family protein [Pikeienuella sp.]
MKLFYSTLFVLGGALSACVPADGPSVYGVMSSARENNIPVVELTEEAVRTIGAPFQGKSLDRFNSPAYGADVIKPGDVISVSIFDNGESGIFIAAESASVDLGEYTVSDDGTVSLPYAGRILVGGGSTDDAQQRVNEKLRASAVNPYTNVSITRKSTDTYAVLGSVASGGNYNLTAKSERVLDAVAAAGGPTISPNETMVTLVRNGATGKQTLKQVILSAKQNVRVQPGDVLIVSGGDATFTADGALSSSGEFHFVEGDLTLAQAVARSGGLSDTRSNPSAVFLLRSMPADETIEVQSEEGEPTQLSGDLIMVTDFDDAAQRLRAGRFYMRDGDSLYVSNSSLTNYTKFLHIFGTTPEVPTPSVPQM